MRTFGTASVLISESTAFRAVKGVPFIEVSSFQESGFHCIIYLPSLSRYPLYSNGSQQLVHHNGKNGLMVDILHMSLVVN